MELARCIKINRGFVKNLPNHVRSELIILDDVIPDGINASLRSNDSIFNKERGYFISFNEDILQKMYDARAKVRFIPGLDGVDKRTEQAIEFIKKYPQFKQLIESIDYVDGDFNIVKVVPIDEYLAEN